MKRGLMIDYPDYYPRRSQKVSRRIGWRHLRNSRPKSQSPFFFCARYLCFSGESKVFETKLPVASQEQKSAEKKRFWPTGTWKMLLDVTCIYLSPVTSKQLEAQLTSLWWELIHKAMAGTCSNAMHSTLKPKKNPKKNRDPGFWFQ